jgi:hypothetical protein
MKQITDTYSLEINWASILQEEIEKDSQSWFWPKSNDHKIFEQAHMKFINGNLNYFHFGNMVASVLEKDIYNPNYTKSLEFCNYARTLTGNIGPFGRMCIWKLPPKKGLLTHVDNFQYHRQIVRNIFVISNHSSENNTCEIVIAGNKINVSKGSLFQFFPADESHSFVNNSDNDFYFLGFDFWLVDNLKKSIINTSPNLYNLMFDTNRLTNYGAVGTNFKFMSGH